MNLFFLQAYDLDIRHIRGTDNVVADTLSWKYECDNKYGIIYYLKLGGVTSLFIYIIALGLALG